MGILASPFVFLVARLLKSRFLGRLEPLFVTAIPPTTTNLARPITSPEMLLAAVSRSPALLKVLLKAHLDHGTELGVPSLNRRTQHCNGTLDPENFRCFFSALRAVSCPCSKI
jgi:hypothetical protein